MKESSKSAVLGITLTLLGGIFWGFSGSCGQYLFTNCGVTPRWLVPIRMISTGAILLGGAAVKNKKKIFDLWRNGRRALRMLAFTLFGLVMCQFAYFKAIELSNAGVATVLQYLSPAMILVYTCVKGRKKPTAAEAISILLAIGGTFLIATGGDVGGLALSLPALLWGLAAGVFLVCYSLIPVPLVREYDTPTVLGWGMLLGGLVLLPVFRPWEINPRASLELFGALGGIIILGTVLAYSFYLEGIRRIGATRASVLSSIEPVSATVISAVWLGTGFTLTDIIGFAMIISTIFIISLFPRKD